MGGKDFGVRALARRPAPLKPEKQFGGRVFDFGGQSSSPDGMTCSSDAGRQTPITKHTNRSFGGHSRRCKAQGRVFQALKLGLEGVRTHFFMFAALRRELVAWGAHD